MNPVAHCAAALLEAHPHPALRIGELLGPVADRVDRSLTPRRLRQALTEHPETFRLLDPWTGPWRTLTTRPAAGAESLGATSSGGAPRALGQGTGPGGAEPDADVWVVLLTRPSAATSMEPAMHLTLRESVRWIARSVDDRSPLSVSRWYALALAERECRRALARRANAA